VHPRPESITPDPAPAGRPRHWITPSIDSGWLLLLAGVALLAAALLIPAADELSEARWQRDRTIALERAHLERLDRHRTYLEALLADDPGLARSLAVSQLNLVPEDRAAIDSVNVIEPSTDVFAALEPAPPVLPVHGSSDSTLARLALGSTSRLWLIAIGALLTLIGLLPQSPRRVGARPYRLTT